MLERIARGELPAKPHTQLNPQGALRYEHCLTRDGFDGAFSILYHAQRPQAARLEPSDVPWPELREANVGPLQRSHFLPNVEPSLSGDSLRARIPLLFNPDVVASRVAPTLSNESYFSNADGDTLLFIHQGGGSLLSPFGLLKFEARDYVFIPKSVPHRFELTTSGQQWFEVELRHGFRFPDGYTNAVGQLRMDAPFSHRDFGKPEFLGPIDEGIHTVLTKRAGRLQLLRYEHSPLDVVGFDGCIYPFTFPVLNFQPKVSSVHLPPTSHGTFMADGVLVCSFVPRPLDFHPQAIPCPYPHSSVDIDEVLFYCDGDFASRRGVGAASVTLHPRGLPHGPHPEKYEGSIGRTHTQELAVMLDCASPLKIAQDALPTMDSAYADSFI